MRIKQCFLGVLTVGGLLAVVYPAFAQTWTPTSAPNENWRSVASSADGSKLVAVAGENYGPPGPIYASTNSGASWYPVSAPLTNWSAVASSADGTRIVAAGGGTYYNYGPIYVSPDSGATWIQTGAPITNWTSVASSADGTKLVAVSWDLRIYTSMDSGATWSQPANAPFGQWTAVTSSADGNKLAVSGCICALLQALSLYTSSDAGETWTATSVGTYPPQSIACSADGTIMAATDFLGRLAVSHNGGTDWSTTNLSVSLVASSADGATLTAMGNGQMYRSTNGGQTWLQSSTPDQMWQTLVSSADGARLFAIGAHYDSPTSVSHRIWTWQSTARPVLRARLSGTNAVLSWIVPSTDFVLQENSDLTTTNWADVPGAPALNFSTLQHKVTLPLATSNRFYRLKN